MCLAIFSTQTVDNKYLLHDWFSHSWPEAYLLTVNEIKGLLSKLIPYTERVWPTLMWKSTHYFKQHFRDCFHSKNQCGDCDHCLSVKAWTRSTKITIFNSPVVTPCEEPYFSYDFLSPIYFKTKSREMSPCTAYFSMHTQVFFFVCLVGFLNSHALR